MRSIALIYLIFLYYVVVTVVYPIDAVFVSGAERRLLAARWLDLGPISM